MGRPDLRPKKCNLCGGPVVFEKVPRYVFESGRRYICTQCGAYVGTHKKHPRNAMGSLANFTMRELRKACHILFDKKWTTYEERDIEYQKLASKLKIPFEECHFGYMDTKQLTKALEILRSEDPVYRVLHGLDFKNNNSE